MNRTLYIEGVQQDRVEYSCQDWDYCVSYSAWDTCNELNDPIISLESWKTCCCHTEKCNKPDVFATTTEAIPTLASGQTFPPPLQCFDAKKNSVVTCEPYEECYSLALLGLFGCTSRQYCSDHLFEQDDCLSEDLENLGGPCCCSSDLCTTPWLIPRTTHTAPPYTGPTTTPWSVQCWENRNGNLQMNQCANNNWCANRTLYDDGEATGDVEYFCADFDYCASHSALDTCDFLSNEQISWMDCCWCTFFFFLSFLF